MRAQEFKPKKLVIFDIDDTLVHTQTKVHVVKDNQVTQSLNSHDFTHYKLQPGESFDFGDFRDAREFFEKSKPIIPMINLLKRDINTGNKVVMVTARADFDDRELFLDTFRKYGVDMSRVHVYRAGNMTQKVQTEEKKKIIIRELLNRELYTKAIMYDDAEPNLHAFISLKDEYPHTKFYAWHVSLDGEANEYHRTDETVTEARRKKKKKLRAAYGPGLFGGYGYYAGYGGYGNDSSGDGGGGESIQNENFADGKRPQDKGDSKRHGINTKASVSSLRKTAKSGGRKGQLAHWLANMKSGRAKKKNESLAVDTADNLLDDILKDLCKLIIAGQQRDSKKFGVVGACIMDAQGNKVYGLNLPAMDNKRRHAERVAIDTYLKEYGDIPRDSICITTCSPCTEDMDERYGESCTELLEQHGIKEIYCGYKDPSQAMESSIETDNKQIKTLCKKFADTFLEKTDESAGVGIVNKQNSTVDVGPGTLNKMLRAYRL